MLRTLEAVIEPDGRVRLLEPIALPSGHRALVTVLDEVAETTAGNATALLSEAALAEDWDRPEEAAAWEHLQSGA